MNEVQQLQAADPLFLRIGELGTAFVWLAIVGCLVAAVTNLIGREDLLKKFADWPFVAGVAGFVGAAGCLLVLFLNKQYQFQYVFEHIANDHELQYLIAGVWSGQEGSFLLWGLLSAIVGFFAVRGAGKYKRWMTFVYALFLAAVAGILAFESPFVLLQSLGGQSLVVDGVLKVMPDGFGLAPSLLNYWMVIHPPTIFTGFSCLTVLFAYSMAALMHRDAVSWIPLVRPWAIFTLTILGVGLCMGGFWAYETLGWGGFWLWDPECSCSRRGRSGSWRTSFLPLCRSCCSATARS